MAQLMEYAEYLSKEIGPRPAGTEEERQAALYITEQFQKGSGFTAQIEEFTSTSNLEGISAIPGAVVIVVAILAMIFPVLSIPAFIFAAIAAATYSLEAFGRPVITRTLARGASQNVVAKYQPNPDAGRNGRSRKVVLVAHYDSGKVTPSLVQRIESVKLPAPIGLVCVVGIILAAFFLLIHVFVNAGIPGVVVNVLTVIALVVCAYPVLRAILIRTAPYNEGANNNASGAAALLEVARRISRGSVSEADLADSEGVRIHGERAARESGLVPEGAQIRYEAEQLVPPAELGSYDDEERLLSAKAAIAALTGQPVERRVYGSAARELVNSRAHGEDPDGFAPAPVGEPAPADGESASQPAVAEGAPQASSAADAIQADAVGESPSAPVGEGGALQPAGAPEPAPLPAIPPAADVDGYKNAPSWFVAAQQNAKRPAGDTGPVQRSRYADAIEAAEREVAERERARQEQERLQREAELRAREKAARAAIAASTPPLEAPAAIADDAIPPIDAGASSDPRASEADAAQAAGAAEPVFTPYQPEPVPAGQAHGQPADDAFAASLGSTTAFQPVDHAPAPSPANLAAEGARPEKAAGPQGEIPNARLAGLPAIERPENTSPSRSGMFRKLRTDVPSLSGVIRMQAAGEDVSQLPARQPAPDSPKAAGAALRTPAAEGGAPQPKAAPAPASVAERPDYDMPLDSEPEPEPEFVDEGALYDEPASVEMPKSRAGGFLGRFRRKDRGDLEETPQEWLDVDDDFDARTVGRERGGWESFREEADAGPDAAGSRRNRTWEGGAASRVRLGYVDTRSEADADAGVPDGSYSVDDDHQIADEIEQIYHFRNPLYNTEIWFVALGSDTDAHDGANAFIAEHADELRGSMVIEVESLGAGELCVATEEGRVTGVTASSRVKRYTRAATAATGIAPGSVSLAGSDSAASVFQKAGYQAMHLLGVEGGRPALKGSPDDIMENLDDLLLDDHVNFLMELLKK